MWGAAPPTPPTTSRLACSLTGSRRAPGSHEWENPRQVIQASCCFVSRERTDYQSRGSREAQHEQAYRVTDDREVRGPTARRFRGDELPQFCHKSDIEKAGETTTSLPQSGMILPREGGGEQRVLGGWRLEAEPPHEDAQPPPGQRLHCRSAGGVGAQPPQMETPRAGGRARAARSALSPRYGAAMTSVSAARWAAFSSGLGFKPKNSTARAARPSSTWTGALAWKGASSSGSSSTIVRTQRR